MSNAGWMRGSPSECAHRSLSNNDAHETEDWTWPGKEENRPQVAIRRSTDPLEGRRLEDTV